MAAQSELCLPASTFQLQPKTSFQLQPKLLSIATHNFSYSKAIFPLHLHKRSKYYICTLRKPTLSCSPTFILPDILKVFKRCIKVIKRIRETIKRAAPTYFHLLKSVCILNLGVSQRKGGRGGNILSSRFSKLNSR